MSGHQYDDAIVDVARGAILGADALAALDAHLASCDACTRRLRHEQALTRDLGGVVRAAAGERAPDTLERRLLEAFARHHALVPTRRGHAWRRWVEAAAAIVVIASAPQVWRALRTKTPVPALTMTQEVPATAPQITKHMEAPPATPVVPVRRGNARVVRPAAPGERASRSDFVALPGAAGLPQFESGTIVRVELPLASLPAFGVDISPAGRDRPVEADVLVGQDGHARAIRLVTNN